MHKPRIKHPSLHLADYLTRVRWSVRARVRFTGLILLTTTVAAFALLQAGCGGTTEPESNDPFQAIVDSGGGWQNEDVNTTEDVVEEIPQERNGTFWVCEKKTVSLERNASRFFVTGSGANLYPGAILQGQFLNDNPPPVVPVDRGPGTILINLFTGEDSVETFKNIPVVKQSTVTEAVNELLQNRDEFPAAFAVTMEEVHSAEHLRIEAGLNVDTFKGDFSADFQFDNDVKKSRYLIKLAQRFYEIIFEEPTLIEDWFGSNVRPEDLDPYVGPNNPPVYIKSINYGRIVYILIETTVTDLEWEAEVKFAYEKLGQGVSVEAKVAYDAMRDESRIEAFVYGGDMTVSEVTGDWDTINEAVGREQPIGLGVPLSYTLADLKTRRAVKVKEATTYDEFNCVPIEDSIEDPIVWFDGNHGVEYIYTGPPPDFSDFYFVTKWTSKFPSGIEGTPTNSNLCGFWEETHLNGQGVVNFRTGSVSVGNRSGQLKYDGRGFEGSDYTVFVVLSVGGAGGSGVRNFSWGASNAPNEYLALGMDGNTNEIYMSHGPNQILGAPIGTPGWAMYTFRFSQIEGMSIYENDRLIGSNASLTSPVRVFPEAQIGSADETFTPQTNSVWLGQFKAYGSAVSEAQRRAQIIKWLTRFGL